MQFFFHDPASDFSDGIAVINCYHQDFIARGKQLLALAQKIDQQGIDASLANQCIAAHLHYTHANIAHHQDEELALFPTLIDASPLIIGMMQRLIIDHEEIEQAWHKLASHLKAPTKISTPILPLATTFDTLQQSHLHREDSDFIPEICKFLTPKTREQIGAKMAKLREKTPVNDR